MITESKANLKNMIKKIIHSGERKYRVNNCRVAEALEELAEFYRELDRLDDFLESQRDGDEFIGHRD